MTWQEDLQAIDNSHVAWQMPNATEAYAAHTVYSRAPHLAKCYLSYPWATWIDRAHRGLSRPLLPQRYRKQQERGLLCTVCQHIWALEHVELFLDSGVTDLFWSHTPKGLTHYRGLRIHPFPLYPVRYASHPPKSEPRPACERPLLYSFIGAYDESLYISSARSWIFELPQRADAVVKRRGEWHYEQYVYREQLLGMAHDSKQDSKLKEEALEYANTLEMSCFSLCPSGSGPNSIRIWEALGFGAIPVIIADSLKLPGDQELWQGAAIVVSEREDSVANLPVLLEEIASDRARVATLQNAGKKLWERYGLGGFTLDIQDLISHPAPTLYQLAKQRLGGNPQSLRALDPVQLPLQVMRWRTKAETRDGLVIEVVDGSCLELLRIRWCIPLSFCHDLLESGRWAVSSLSPTLEQIPSPRQESTSSRLESIA